MRNNLKAYIEYTSGKEGYYARMRSLRALQRIYKEHPYEIVVSFDKDTLEHHDADIVITIDDAKILIV